MLSLRLPYYKRFYLLISLFTIAGWFWLLSSTTAAGQDVSLCLFKKATGLPCPSCGSTTSIQLLLSGDWLGALYKNPLGYLLGLGLVILPVWLLADLLLQATSLYNAMESFNQKVRTKPIILIIILIPLTANWIWMLMK